MVATTGSSSTALPGGEPMDVDLHGHEQQVEELETELAEPEPEPEPEGPRMTRLRGILNKSLQETLKSCNFNAICECFPILAATKPEDLHEVHRKVCQFLSLQKQQ
ncbi:hypothetical protein BGZ65_004973 [Modicella reniformis]|uniref:Uncharacterized protein n=1 Tax=Modicella reniformis TaxID=1440133 RepID=A0A9P6MH09_9FUNG|nr:hypothetical protein BGZ65_004973 [Modicella reniformis]